MANNIACKAEYRPKLEEEEPEEKSETSGIAITETQKKTRESEQGKIGKKGKDVWVGRVYVASGERQLRSVKCVDPVDA
ncbi:hypothetical protein MRX96_023909 [Rhipicephalus microplus]